MDVNSRGCIVISIGIDLYKGLRFRHHNTSIPLKSKHEYFMRRAALGSDLFLRYLPSHCLSLPPRSLSQHTLPHPHRDGGTSLPRASDRAEVRVPKMSSMLEQTYQNLRQTISHLERSDRLLKPPPPTRDEETTAIVQTRELETR